MSYIKENSVKDRVMIITGASSGFGRAAARKAAALGGAGLVIPGGMVIDGEWPTRLPLEYCIYDDSFLPGLTRLANLAHENGAKILF